ncbi:MAG: hypothetical protein KGI54_14820 [Pseudomonadota bacterium]|nr:hypothetical protein [Pseudomonadota bacterium]
MWTVNSCFIKGLVFGLSYEDDPDVLGDFGLNFAVIVEIGLIRITLFKYSTDEEEDNDA